MPSAKLPPHNCKKSHKQSFCQAGFQLPSVCSKTSETCTPSAKANKETSVRRENGSEVGALVSRGSDFSDARSPAAVPHLQGRSQPGRDVPHGCCLPHAAAQPQHGWEFHILSPPAAGQGKPGPLTDQTHTDPLFTAQQPH